MITTRSIRILMYFLAFALAIAAGAWRLPAYTSRLPMMMLLAVADLYLLQRLSGSWLGLTPVLRKTLQLFTVLPSFLVMIFFASMAFVTPLDWNPVLRTHWLGAAMILYIIKAFPLIILIKIDVHRWLIGKRLANHFIRSYRMFARLSLILATITAIILLLGVFRWAYDFEVTEKSVVIAGLPKAFSGFRIVQISDFHLGRFHSPEKLNAIVESVNNLRPDMVVFTGDLVNYATAEAEPFEPVLTKIKAVNGVYAVLGNHDYGDYLRWTSEAKKEENIIALQNFLARIGWTLLRNENRAITRDSSRIFIAGIDHWSPHRRFPVRANLDMAMQDINDNDFVLFLAHDPVFWQRRVLTSDFQIGLTLSGHTHAFQLGFKCAGNDWSPPALFKKYWKGLYSSIDSLGNQRLLYVNAGLGHIMYPGRVGMKPEITLLLLYSK